MELWSGLGILLGFLVLMISVWKKISLLLATLAASAIIAGFGGLNIADIWTGPYMEGFAGFAGDYLLLFCIGAMFGKILEDSGASWRLATTIVDKAGEKWSLVAFCGLIMLLLYGGVSIFVIIFIILPIGKNLFERLQIPWSYFPAIALIGTIPPVGMLPGSLQILNIIPTQYFGTNLMAGAWVGIIASIVYLVLAAVFVRFLLKNSEQKFDIKEFQNIKASSSTQKDYANTAPNVWISILPIMVALASVNIFNIEIIIGLLVASVLAVLLFWKSLQDIISSLSKGAENGFVPLIYVSVVVGVARVVEQVPFFEVAQELLFELPVNELLIVMAVTSVIAAMTGSSSGSLTMIVDLFGETFVSWGYDPELVHRLMSTTAIGLDAVPWNSVIVVMFTLTGVAFAKGYKYVFVTAVILPLVGALSILMVSPVFY
ncbi:GntP family permease [Alkalicoccus saliphilus]|uniref:Citrate transporter n=1 Tax=Alkalicoccus saliphilus TaxID=200989 RepID=A0A2T4U4V8_9BACI|nr:SLC13 family permease [Alkalicoccus saliphilus]PTL38419.1 hypothetical protein C6Y45_11000 [Alkalicoccus saliphilus]